MHPYHMKEYIDERHAELLRSARQHQIVAEARVRPEPEAIDTEHPRRGRGFRIPGFNWQLRVQPARSIRPAR